jgi:methylmalonyl-CoA mutase
MLDAEFHIADDFPPAAYDRWRALAEADLAGAPFAQKLVSHTYEGIDVQPVYTRADCPGERDAHGFPGLAPFIRGSVPLGAVESGWDLRQEHAHPDLGETKRAILDDLGGGATSLLLRLDAAARRGLDPDEETAGDYAGRDGIMAYCVDDLDAALAGVHLQMIGVTLEAGAAFAPAAAVLAAQWQRHGVPLAQAHGAFNADPLAVLVRDGHLPCAPEAAMGSMAELAAWTARNCPHVTAVRVGTAPYHHAGATAVQDIAFGTATAVEYLRAMNRHGLDVATAARQILFSISLGTHHFLAIAKLRASRQVWSRVLDACGAGAPMRIHARISKRVLTQRDPYVNLLRNTAACYAAGLGGAEAITSVPFDIVAGLPSDLGRRIARNTVHILQEEAHLNRVVDPGGGSWYLDALTDGLAEKAWALFQEIERHGGMLQAIQSGWIAEQIESAFAPRARNLARRKEGITGVSEFPETSEPRLVRPVPDTEALRRAAMERIARVRKSSPMLTRLPTATDRITTAVEAAGAGASIGQLAAALGLHAEPTAMAPLAPHPFAEPFEALREAADAWVTEHGERPRVFLVAMGSPAHFTGRATYARNFFAAGGFGVVAGSGYKDAESAVVAFRESGARIAVICSSDKLYPEVVPQLGARLKASGARSVILAGNPGVNESAWRAAGVDRFIFVKCDVLATLRDMLREEGILGV